MGEILWERLKYFRFVGMRKWLIDITTNLLVDINVVVILERDYYEWCYSLFVRRL
jgi:hypothetical protein